MDNAIDLSYLKDRMEFMENTQFEVARTVVLTVMSIQSAGETKKTMQN